ncbi:MAG: haloacid dehalogenase [Chloroflexi bacterium]|nr:haloacid dehalogenase [Chloroflexota bacterium]
MQELEKIAEGIHKDFEAHTAARDQALTQARTLTRHCAQAIRAVHRDEKDVANQHLVAARELVQALRESLQEYPNVYYAGYSQDALKEYAEANIVYALVDNGKLPTPEDLGLENATYLKGLSEAVGELRRRCLDILRSGHSNEVERLLEHMNEIYAVLVTMDYPDAVTGGLRRLTDISRSLIERTRGDITLSVRQERLENQLRKLDKKLGNQSLDNSKEG